MPTFAATGITLIVRKYRGSERLATFFTRERGKVEAVAKGVGKPGGTLAPAVEPLTLSRLFFAEGRSLEHLTQAQVLNSFEGLRSDLTRFGHGSYIAELTALATEPGQPQPVIFELLEAALGAIEEGRDPQIIAQGYALRLMCVLGVAPVLGECVTCSRELTGPVGYSAAAGGLICPDCETPDEGSLTVSPASCGVLHSLITLPLERLERLRMDEASRRQVTGLLRRHIEYHLGLKLRSEEFLDKLGAEGGRL